MKKDIKIDVATTAFSSCADRFVKSGYKYQYSFAKQVELISQIDGITGLALDYPSQYDNPQKLKSMLDNVGLVLGMTEIDMYSNSKWKYGSLASSDDKLRREAIDLVKKGIDTAIEAGGADVQLWLGQDGYDYSFQCNLPESWSRLMDAIVEIGEYQEKMKISIEYKIKEPRCRCFIGTVGKALLLCERTGKKHVGITLDVGHSLMALENPAESAALAMNMGRLFHLHLNDNYRDWDHDMLPGTVNLWETIELFYWLEKMKFDGWYGIDVYPYREDGERALKQTVENIYKYREIAQKLLNTNIENLQKNNDSVAIFELLKKEILK